MSAGEPARLGIHAASWTELQYRLSDFDVTDPGRPGRPLLLLPRVALSGIGLQNAELGPDGGGGPGARVSLQPTRSAAKWQGRLGFQGAPSSLQTDVPAASAPALVRLREAFELQALSSGPLRGERLGATFAFEWERAERSERGAPERLRNERKSALGQLSFAPSPQDEARLLLAGHDATLASSGSDAAGSDAFFAGLSWLRRRDGGGRWQASLHYTASDQSAGPPAPVRSLERLESGPIADAAHNPGRLRVVRGEAGWWLRARDTGKLRHEPSFTAQLEHARVLTDASPSFVVAELVDARPARAWSWSAAAPGRRSQPRLGASIGDAINVADRLYASLGLQLDLVGGSREDQSELVSWRYLSPHASLQARPVRGLPLLLHAGFARHAGRTALPLLVYGDPSARSAEIHRWTDPNRDGLFQPAERGVLVARVGPGGLYTELDRYIAAPRTTEFTAGLSYERGRARFTFAGVHRRTRGFPETLNVAVPASSYRVRLIPDPGVDLVGAQDDQLLRAYDRDPATFGQDRYLLTSPEGHDVTYEGVETALELRPAEGLRLRLGGTASKTTGAGANRGFRVGENDPGLPGELYDNPNADSFATGRMFFDRAYTLKLAGVFRRGAWGAGFVARYSDGQPFARVVVVEGLAQGPEAVAAVSRGDHRFTYILTVDARLSRDFEIGRARATASVEAFSLGRQRREVEEYVVSGPDFRRVTATQPPRALRLGLALAF